MKIMCDRCNGAGWYEDHAPSYLHDDEGGCIPGNCPIQVECEKCNGSGEIECDQVRDKILAIFNSMAMEPERAECYVNQIMQIFDDEIKELTSQIDDYKSGYQGCLHELYTNRP